MAAGARAGAYDLPMSSSAASMASRGGGARAGGDFRPVVLGSPTGTAEAADASWASSMGGAFSQAPLPRERGLGDTRGGLRQSFASSAPAHYDRPVSQQGSSIGTAGGGVGVRRYEHDHPAHPSATAAHNPTLVRLKSGGGSSGSGGGGTDDGREPTPSPRGSSFSPHDLDVEEEIAIAADASFRQGLLLGLLVGVLVGSGALFAAVAQTDALDDYGYGVGLAREEIARLSLALHDARAAAARALESAEAAATACRNKRAGAHADAATAATAAPSAQACAAYLDGGGGAAVGGDQRSLGSSGGGAANGPAGAAVALSPAGVAMSVLAYVLSLVGAAVATKVWVTRRGAQGTPSASLKKAGSTSMSTDPSEGGEPAAGEKTTGIDTTHHAPPAVRLTGRAVAVSALPVRVATADVGVGPATPPGTPEAVPASSPDADGDGDAAADAAEVVDSATLTAATALPPRIPAQETAEVWLAGKWRLCRVGGYAGAEGADGGTRGGAVDGAALTQSMLPETLRVVAGAAAMGPHDHAVAHTPAGLPLPLAVEPDALVRVLEDMSPEDLHALEHPPGGTPWVARCADDDTTNAPRAFWVPSVLLRAVVLRTVHETPEAGAGGWVAAVHRALGYHDDAPRAIDVHREAPASPAASAGVFHDMNAGAVGYTRGDNFFAAGGGELRDGATAPPATPVASRAFTAGEVVHVLLPVGTADAAYAAPASPTAGTPRVGDGQQWHPCTLTAIHSETGAAVVLPEGSRLPETVSLACIRRPGDTAGRSSMLAAAAGGGSGIGGAASTQRGRASAWNLSVPRGGGGGGVCAMCGHDSGAGAPILRSPPTSPLRRGGASTARGLRRSTGVQCGLSEPSVAVEALFSAVQTIGTIGSAPHVAPSASSREGGTPLHPQYSSNSPPGSDTMDRRGNGVDAPAGNAMPFATTLSGRRIEAPTTRRVEEVVQLACVGLEAEIVKEKTRASAAVDEMRDLAAKLEAAETAHAAEVERLQAILKAKGDTQRVQEIVNAACRGLERELGEEKSTTARLRTRVVDAATRMDAALANHAAEMAALGKAGVERMQAHAAELDELRSSHAQEVARLRESMLQVVAATQEQHERVHAEQRQQVAALHEQLRDPSRHDDVVALACKALEAELAAEREKAHAFKKQLRDLQEEMQAGAAALRDEASKCRRAETEAVLQQNRLESEIGVERTKRSIAVAQLEQNEARLRDVHTEYADELARLRAELRDPKRVEEMVAAACHRLELAVETEKQRAAQALREVTAQHARVSAAEHAAARAERDADAAIAAGKAAVEAAEAAHAERMREIEGLHDAQVEELRAAHEAVLRETAAAHEGDVREVTARLRAEVAEMVAKRLDEGQVEQVVTAACRDLQDAVVEERHRMDDAVLRLHAREEELAQALTREEDLRRALNVCEANAAASAAAYLTAINPRLRQP